MKSLRAIYRSSFSKALIGLIYLIIPKYPQLKLKVNKSTKRTIEIKTTLSSRKICIGFQDISAFDKPTQTF